MSKNVKPYNNLQSKKDQVKQMFDNISYKYDFLNQFLTLGIDSLWRKEVVKKINNNPSEILDIATGTADIAILAAKHLNAQITGLDISNEMLKIGQKKINNQNLENRIKLVSGDAENLVFENESFDAITIGFGVRNFENLNKGLNESFRVLKKNGYLVILEPSYPTKFPIKQFFSLYFNYITPFIGNLISKDFKAYRYLAKSVKEFPSNQMFLNKLKEIGFSKCNFHSLSFGVASLYVAIK